MLVERESAAEGIEDAFVEDFEAGVEPIENLRGEAGIETAEATQEIFVATDLILDAALVIEGEQLIGLRPEGELAFDTVLAEPRILHAAADQVADFVERHAEEAVKDVAGIVTAASAEVVVFAPGSAEEPEEFFAGDGKASGSEG